MIKLCYGGALLLALPLGSAAHPVTPDSTVVTRRHLLTLHTLHIAAPFIPALGYEAPVRPRWSVRTSLGSQHDSFRSSYTTTDATGTLLPPTSVKYRFTNLIADVSLNYYLQGSKPALIGWFVGAGLMGGLARTHVAYEGPSPSSNTSYNFSVRPLLRAGRHWAIGQRWIVDTHIGVLVSSYRTQRIALQEVLGAGVGYRL